MLHSIETDSHFIANTLENATMQQPKLSHDMSVSELSALSQSAYNRLLSSMSSDERSDYELEQIDRWSRVDRLHRELNDELCKAILEDDDEVEFGMSNHQIDGLRDAKNEGDRETSRAVLNVESRIELYGQRIDELEKSGVNWRTFGEGETIELPYVR